MTTRPALPGRLEGILGTEEKDEHHQEAMRQKEIVARQELCKLELRKQTTKIHKMVAVSR